MNRVFATNRPSQKAPSHSANAYLRPTRRLRDDAESMLRDIAYVLYLTQRVKTKMLQERELYEAAMA